MTDVRWIKDAPKAPGWYWCRIGHTDKKTPWPCQVWRGPHGVIENRNWTGDMTREFGPPIPSPEVLARAMEFLRKPEIRYLYGDEAGAILAELEKR